jgi:hypothetical protein
MYGIYLNWNGTAAPPLSYLLGWSPFLWSDRGTRDQEGPFHLCVPDDSISRREESDDELSFQMMRLSEASLKEIWDDPAEDVWDRL